MDLFKGQELLKADGSKVSADSALKGKDYVCLYFSAHWCPPCRMFTPKLKEWYKEVQDKNVEIIFVSGDRSEKDMMDYMKESHGDWLATEHDSELSDKLNEKFEVSGIPSLVVLKGDGTLVTKGGRADVSQHGKDAIEAWGKTVVDLLKGQTFIKVDDTKVAADDVIASKKFIGFYFSAHWCPPCRMFTPKLKEWYAEAKEKGVEIVFVSADKDAQAMKDYMKGRKDRTWWNTIKQSLGGGSPYDSKKAHGDWLAVEHGSDLTKSLGSKFGVEGIPSLAIIKPDGTVVTDEGVEAVMEKGQDAIKEWEK